MPRTSFMMEKMIIPRCVFFKRRASNPAKSGLKRRFSEKKEETDRSYFAMNHRRLVAKTDNTHKMWAKTRTLAKLAQTMSGFAKKLQKKSKKMKKRC